MDKYIQHFSEEKVYRKHMEGLPKANKGVSNTLRVALYTGIRYHIAFLSLIPAAK